MNAVELLPIVGKTARIPEDHRPHHLRVSRGLLNYSRHLLYVGRPTVPGEGDGGRLSRRFRLQSGALVFVVLERVE